MSRCYYVGICNFCGLEGVYPSDPGVNKNNSKDGENGKEGHRGVGAFPPARGAKNATCLYLVFHHPFCGMYMYEVWGYIASSAVFARH